jgi:hypothetical protein
MDSLSHRTGKICDGRFSRAPFMIAVGRDPGREGWPEPVNAIAAPGDIAPGCLIPPVGQRDGDDPERPVSVQRNPRRRGRTATTAPRLGNLQPDVQVPDADTRATPGLVIERRYAARSVGAARRAPRDGSSLDDAARRYGSSSGGGTRLDASLFRACH